jgi:hypothetical protein
VWGLREFFKKRKKPFSCSFCLIRKYALLSGVCNEAARVRSDTAEQARILKRDFEKKREEKKKEPNLEWPPLVF